MGFLSDLIALKPVQWEYSFRHVERFIRGAVPPSLPPTTSEFAQRACDRHGCRPSLPIAGGLGVPRTRQLAAVTTICQERDYTL